jgi:mRNA interferase YafQ
LIYKYNPKPTTKFKRDLKRIEKRGYKIDLLAEVIKKLVAGETLDERYNDHPLKCDYIGCRECHITPDWLLIYEISNDTLFLYLTRTGTHPNLYS